MWVQHEDGRVTWHDAGDFILATAAHARELEQDGHADRAEVNA